jgi:prepilin-type N-terminal cleavage/methylation domain-containing protein
MINKHAEKNQGEPRRFWYTKNSAGFSLIELMVVIAIIGTLYSVVALSVQSSRKKARDAKRAADIKQLASALENYFTGNNAYPTQTPASTTIPGLNISYIGQIPQAPTPVEDNCSGQNDYMYESVDGITYTITFCLGGGTGDYAEGPHFLTQQGVR